MPLDTNVMDAKGELKSALQSLCQCRQKAKELRKSFLDNKIEAAALAEDATTEKMLKKMRHCKARSACLKMLDNALEPAGHRGRVTKVELKVDGHTVACTEKNNVERETKKRNRNRFNAPAGPPFAVLHLSEAGLSATDFKTTHPQDRTAVQMPPGTFLETETFLELLKTLLPGAADANTSGRISLEDFTSAIKVWKERASTSPSGCHLGHCKLLVKTMEDKNAPEEVQSAARDILTLMVTMLDLASEKGFILERWIKVINVMMHNEPGAHLIEKL